VLMSHGGADPNKPSQPRPGVRGETPLDFAWAKQDTCLIELLQKTSVPISIAAPSTATFGTAESTESALAVAETAPARVAPSTDDSNSTPSTCTAMAVVDSVQEQSPPGAGKRKNRTTYRTTPMADRAQRAGVAHKLKPLPTVPANGPNSPYRKALKAVQTANQQTVSRAEEKMASQLAAERISRITQHK
jgi:hypothetical protein